MKTNLWYELYDLGRKYGQLEVAGKSTSTPLSTAKTLIGGDPFQTVAFNYGRQLVWENTA